MPRPLRLARLVRLAKPSFLLATALCTAAAEPRGIAAPRAERGADADVLHGTRVPDPYRSLENLGSEATRSWLRAQDEMTRHALDGLPAFERSLSRLEALTSGPAVGVPTAAGGRLFYLGIPAGGSQPSAWVVDREGVPPRLLIDGASLADRMRLSGFWPDRDGKLLAYATSDVASNWMTLRFLEVATGRVLGDLLDGLHVSAGGVAWAADGAAVFYGRFEPPVPGAEREATLRGERLMRHQLGTAQTKDSVLLDLPEEPTWRFSPRVSDDGRLLVLTLTPAAGTEARLLVRDLADPSADFHAVAGGPGTANRYLASQAARIVVQTSQGAPRGRVVALELGPGAEDPTSWETLLPESEHALYFTNVVAGRIIAVYVREARHDVEIYSPAGRLERRVALPDLGTTFSGFVGRSNDTYAYYSFNGIAYPGTASVFRIDPASGESVPFQPSDLGFDPTDFVTGQVFYTSRDGTRVPMFVAHRRDLPRDGRRPVFLYAYGAFGWPATPWFQPQILAWLESGGVYALANVRGGGEYGEAWHEAGRGKRRQNVVDDYLAAVDWLLASGWTSPGLLVGNGGSASGPLVAGAMIQRPELFGAVVIDIPILDLVRFDRFTGGARWRNEFGSPEVQEEFEVLLGLSPYHNLEPGTCYPPVLVTAGELDETAPPLHAYKFVARLQEVQSCEAPALLQVVWGGGHAFGTTREQRAETWARQLAFLDRVLSAERRDEAATGSR